MNRVAAYISSVLAKSAGKVFYDKTMIEKMQIKQCELVKNESRLLIELPLLDEWKNSGGTLHGGAISTLIDQSTTMSIAALDNRHSVSVDLSVTFVSAMKGSENMQIEAVCYKIGKSLAFTSAEIKANGAVVAKGMHTKFMLGTSWEN